MADNHNKNGFEDDGSDFTFDGLEDWEDDAKESPPAQAAGPAAPADADPFGEDSFGADDDVFGAPPSAAKDPFASEEPFAAGPDPFAEDDGFDFQQMPTPSDPGSRQPQAAGDPEEEFGDLAGFEDDGFAPATPSPMARAAAPEHDPFADDAESDPFADDGESAPMREFADVEEDDPFADEHAETTVPVAAAPRASSRGKSGLVFPLALAAALAGVAYVGYTHLLPGFLGGQPSPVVASAPDQPAPPAFPTALPNQPGGLSLPEQPAPTDNGISLPIVPDAGLPPVPAMPSPAEAGTAPVMPGIGEAPSIPDASAPFPPEGSFVPRPVGETPPLIRELSEEGGRGGIANFREPDAAPAAAADIARIEARVAEIERKVENLVDMLDRSMVSPAAQPGLAIPGLAPAVVPPLAAAPAPVEPEGFPPLKPEIVESATLKGVSRGLAWVSTASGVVEVKVGDTVPGAGTVTAVREYEGQWIVVTTSGLILQ